MTAIKLHIPGLNKKGTYLLHKKFPKRQESTESKKSTRKACTRKGRERERGSYWLFFNKQLWANYRIHIWAKIHTEENSKAKGYIRNSCETQSTHCRNSKIKL